MLLKQKKRILAVSGIIVLCIISVLFGGHSKITAQSAIAQAFSTNQALQNGTIVQLNSHSSPQISVLTRADVNNMYGVVVSGSTTPFTLSNPTATSTQVYVASSGDYNTLVSTQNGSIVAGDYISISAINGIGMKADSQEPLILGKALASFNGNNSLLNTTLKSSSGTIKVSIGTVPVAIDVIHNPLIVNTVSDLPSFLTRASKSVTSKTVSAPRVYLSLVIIFVSAVLTGSIIYGSLKSSIIAIGRNPLSRKMVVRGLVQSVIIGVIIFILGLFAVYLLLTL